MKQAIKPIKIDYCGCDAEGHILVELVSHSIQITCDYQMSDKQISEAFKISTVYEVEISFWLDKVSKTSETTKVVGSNYVIGIYQGKIEIEGEEYFVVNSIFDVYTTNELNGFVEPANIGDWVIAIGAFFLHTP
jgi:hypothetical protein